MKTIRFVFFLALILLTVSSCNKVIELDLRESEIKYVIEGIITNEPGSCKVHITRSKNFNENNQFDKVSGALVSIKDNGVETILPELQAGLYHSPGLSGKPGHSYQLTISVDGENFSASCAMPQPVLMDSLYITRGPFGQFKFATIDYSDPLGINNGYRFIQYVNGVKEPTIFWENDEFTDGQQLTVQLDVSADEKDDPRNIKTGDTVKIEMLCLDEPVYQFWYTMRTGGGDGDGDTAAPSNPASNISGGALGYFSAHTISSKTVTSP